MTAKESSIFRRLLALAGGVYLFWWFLVEWLVADAYNPLPGRLVVVGYFLLVLALSFPSGLVRRNLPSFYYLGAFLLTLHFYYLFYRNGGSAEWIVGCFITVMAVNYCFFSALPLLAYTAFVLALSVAATALLEPLLHSVFLPGVATIAIQANLALFFRLRMLKNLRESNLRFETLFHSTFEGVLLHEQGVIVDVNRPLAELLGYRTSELRGKSVVDLIAPAARKEIHERIRLPAGKPYETMALTKDGRVIDVEVRARDFFHDRQQARLVAVQDLTDRKLAESERVSIRAMEENVRLRDEFISLASHELKTPLTSLKLWTQLLDRRLKEGSPDGSLLSRMLGQINRLKELIDSMLDVSRLGAAGVRLEREELDLSLLVGEVVRNLEPEGGKLSFRATGPLPLRGDRSRLTQLTENLLTNALKYGGERPVEVRTFREGDCAVLRVRDEGIGIAPADHGRIFERFERITSEKNISGLGLGLYLSREIARAHGGGIAVESALGEGSTFTAKIPFDNTPQRTVG